MDYLTVEGVPPYDGRYEFDLRGSSFSLREWGWIKRHAGYLPLTLEEGLAGSDAELMAVFAIIAMVRAGKVDRDQVPQVWERFGDAPGVLTVRLEFQKTEEEDADPSLPPSSSENGGSSGHVSATSSETSVPGPSRSGTPASAASPSVPTTSAT